MTKLEISVNIDQNRSFSKFCPKAIFPTILTKIEVFWKSSPKSKLFFKDFDQNPYFWNILTEIRIFRKLDINWDFSKIWVKSIFFENFDQNGDVSKIFSKIDIFDNCDQNRGISKIFIEILTKIAIFLNFEIFRTFWLLSSFFNNFDQNQNFRKFGPKSRCFEYNRDFSKIRPKLEIFASFDQNRFSKILSTINISDNFD